MSFTTLSAINRLYDVRLEPIVINKQITISDYDLINPVEYGYAYIEEFDTLPFSNTTNIAKIITDYIVKEANDRSLSGGTWYKFSTFEVRITTNDGFIHTIFFDVYVMFSVNVITRERSIIYISPGSFEFVRYNGLDKDNNNKENIAIRIYGAYDQTSTLTDFKEFYIFKTTDNDIGFVIGGTKEDETQKFYRAFKSKEVNRLNGGLAFGIGVLTGEEDFPVSDEELLKLLWGNPVEVELAPDNSTDTSGTGGGTGGYYVPGSEIVSDVISPPTVPTLSATKTGFVNIYVPSLSQINALSSYLWSSAFDIDSIKKMFANPMDSILGLQIIPYSLTGTDEEIKVAGISTGVHAPRKDNQYFVVDCGSVTINPYYNSCLDYSPFTSLSIFLPYIGERKLDIDEVMNASNPKTLTVTYTVDILSGGVVAHLIVDGSVMYEFSGNCATQIPISSANWGRMISTLATGVIGFTASAGMGSVAGAMATTAVSNVMSMKPDIEHSGQISGCSGQLGVQTPYLIYHLPNQSLASEYGSFSGYPSNITKSLSQLTGYTEIEKIHLEGIPATDGEIDLIERALKEGVLL